MSSAPPTIDQALAVARRLSPRDQAQLIAHLAALLAESPTPALNTADTAWKRWEALRIDIATHFPDAHPAEQLDRDRRERDGVLQNDGV